MVSEMGYVRRALTAARHRLRSGDGGRSDRDRLIKLLPRGGVIAEVGVWRGDFSALLARRLSPRVLHLIDPWAFQPEYKDAWYGGSAARDQADMDAIFEGVRTRFDADIAAGRVLVHRAASVEAAAEFDAESLDVVYIDGDHTYDAVRADLEAWAPRVRRGGYLTGDDYGDGGWWEGGVARAVDEFASKWAWSSTIVGTQFLFRRP